MGPVEQHLSVNEVAQRLSVTGRTVRRWIAEGRLKSSKIRGYLVRIPESAVERLLAEQVPVTPDDLVLERIKKILTDTGYVPEREIDGLAAKIMAVFTAEDDCE